MKVLFSGGGTLGPVTPLIAVMEEMRKTHKDCEFVWISTKNGRENSLLKDFDVKIYELSAAKLRRYFSFENFIDFFRFFKSLFDVYKILKIENPDVVVSAGAYVSVPVTIVSKVFLRKNVLIHQQDIKIGLANKFMSYLADVITVSFEDQLDKFLNKNTFLTGNPSRFDASKCLNKKDIASKYCLSLDKKTVLVLGGSSGAESLNKSVANFSEEIFDKCQIIHVTGLGKKIEKKIGGYLQFEFLKEEMFDILCISDIVITRAGLGTLTELSSMNKCAILVPLLGHQEVNAKYFYEKNCAEIANYDNLYRKLVELLENDDRCAELGNNIASIMPRDGEKKISEKIYGLKKI